MLPLVSTEEDVSIVELLCGSTSGKCVDISGDLVQAIQDGILLMPHLRNGCNLRLHSHELINNWMNPSSQGENVKVPSDKASWFFRRLRNLRRRRRCWLRLQLITLQRPCTGEATEGAPAVSLEVAVPNGIAASSPAEQRKSAKHAIGQLMSIGYIMLYHAKPIMVNVNNQTCVQTVCISSNILWQIRQFSTLIHISIVALLDKLFLHLFTCFSFAKKLSVSLKHATGSCCWPHHALCAS